MSCWEQSHCKWVKAISCCCVLWNKICNYGNRVPLSWGKSIWPWKQLSTNPHLGQGEGTTSRPRGPRNEVFLTLPFFPSVFPSFLPHFFSCFDPKGIQSYIKLKHCKHSTYSEISKSPKFHPTSPHPQVSLLTFWPTFLQFFPYIY